MPAGIQVINNSGYIQIDAEYQNLYLVSKGVLNPPASGNRQDIIPRPSAYPNNIIAVKCTNAWALVLGDANNYRIMVAPDGAGTAGIVEYFIFAARPAGQAVTDNYGLTIWDGTGKVVFNSSDKPLKVVGRLTTPMLKQDDLSGTIGAQGVKLAVVCNIRPTHIETNPVTIQGQSYNIVATWCGSVRSSAYNGWRVVNAPAGSYMGPPTVAYSYTSSTTDYMFIDVAGY